jgi:hypothetical protein
MAGGGIKGGQAIGATDEIGMKAIDTPCDVHDVHATILHLLGLNHVQLTFEHNGGDERPTMTDGQVITKALA